MATLQIKKLRVVHKGLSLEISYSFRQTSQKTLVYIHGMGCSKSDFLGATNIRELSSCSLLALDYPGCGDSPYPPNRKLTIDDLVTITNRVVENLGIHSFIMIGHSMGSVVALLYAKKFPAKVKGLLSVEGNLGPKDSVWPRKVTKVNFSEFRNTLWEPLKKKLKKSPSIGWRKYAETLERYSSPKACFDYCFSLVDYSDSGDLLNTFLELPIPKIFMYGSKNEKSLSYIKTLQRAGCPVAKIPNSEHFPCYDNPKEYYQVITNFLDRIAHPQQK